MAIDAQDGGWLEANQDNWEAAGGDVVASAPKETRMKTLSKQQASTFMALNATATGEVESPGHQYPVRFWGQVVGYGLTPCGPDGYEGEPEQVHSLTLMRKNEQTFSVDVSLVQSIRVILEN